MRNGNFWKMIIRQSGTDEFGNDDKPMGVATYKTTAEMGERLKKVLPPVEELKKLL